MTHPEPNVVGGRPSAVATLLQSLVDNAQLRADHAVSSAVEATQRAAPPFLSDSNLSGGPTEVLDIDQVLADFDLRMNARDARMAEAASALGSRDGGFVSASDRLPAPSSQLQASDNPPGTSQDHGDASLRDVEAPDPTLGQTYVGSTKSTGSKRELRANLITALVVLAVVVAAVLAISLLA